jgi:hypothetical protein
MTRRDFELIARVIKSARGHSVDTDAVLDSVTMRFVGALRETNSGFNEEKFVKACGYVKA